MIPNHALARDIPALDARGHVLARFDKKLCHYNGLKPHDFHRSAARNPVKSGFESANLAQIAERTATR